MLHYSGRRRPGGDGATPLRPGRLISVVATTETVPIPSIYHNLTDNYKYNYHLICPILKCIYPVYLPRSTQRVNAWRGVVVRIGRGPPVGSVVTIVLVSPAGHTLATSAYSAKKLAMRY